MVGNGCIMIQVFVNARQVVNRESYINIKFCSKGCNQDLRFEIPAFDENVSLMYDIPAF